MDPCKGMERDTVLPDLDAVKVDPVTIVEPDHIVDEIAVETDGLLQDIENMDRLKETKVFDKC